MQEQGQGINRDWNKRVSPPTPPGQYFLSPSLSLIYLTNMIGYSLSWFYIMLFLKFFICLLFGCLPGSLRERYYCLPSEKPKLYYHTLGIVSELSCSLDIRICCICQAMPFNFPKHWMFMKCFTCI